MGRMGLNGLEVLGVGRMGLMDLRSWVWAEWG